MGPPSLPGEHGPLPPLKPRGQSWVAEEERRDWSFPPGEKGGGFRPSYKSTPTTVRACVKPSGQVGMGWCLVTSQTLTPRCGMCCKGVSMREPVGGSVRDLALGDALVLPPAAWPPSAWLGCCWPGPCDSWWRSDRDLPAGGRTEESVPSTLTLHHGPEAPLLP